jgi:hypothetical protein
LVVVAGAVAVAFASDWTPGMGKHKGPRGGGANMSLIQFDSNKDGQITRAEIDAGLQAQFQSADTNTDGKLDAAELQRYNDARKAERKARYDAWKAKNPDAKDRRYGDRAGRTGFDPMKNMDWNKDGFVTPEEFGGRVRSQVMRADKDGDGSIAVEDLKRRRDKDGDDKKD